MIHLAIWLVSFCVVMYFAAGILALLIATWKIWLPVLGVLALVIVVATNTNRQPNAAPAAVEAAYVAPQLAPVPIAASQAIAPNPSYDLLRADLPLAVTLPRGEAQLVAAYGEAGGLHVLIRFLALDGRRLLTKDSSNAGAMLRKEFCGPRGVLAAHGLASEEISIIAYEDGVRAGEVRLGAGYCDKAIPLVRQQAARRDER